MPTLSDILRRAARRDRLARAVRGAGWGLLGAGVAIGLRLVTRRLTGDNGGLDLLDAILAVLGVTGGGLLAAASVTRPLGLARRLDQAYRLEDRLATAIQLDGMRHDPSFSALVQRDADRAAGRINLRSALPLAPIGPWRSAVTLALLVVAGHWWLPARTTVAAIEREEAIVDRTEAATTVREAAETLATLPPDPALADERDALEALAAQLSGEDADPATLDDSAASIERVADQLDHAGDLEERALETLADRFRGLDDPNTRPAAPMRADELRDALRRGAFGEAGATLDELLQDAKTTPQRTEEARRLRDLARDLERAAQRSADDLEARRESIRQTLRDQGLSEEQIERWLDDATPPDMTALEDMLSQQGVEEDTARAIQDDLETLQDRGQLEDRVQDELDEVRDALDEAADRLEKPPAPPPLADPTTTPSPPEGEQPPPSTPPTSPDGEQPETPQQTPDGKPQQTPPQAPDGKPQQTPKQAPDGKPQQTPKQSPDGEPQQTPQPSPDGEQQQTPQPSPDGEQQPTPKPSPDGEQQPTPQPSPDGEQQPTPQPSPDGEQQPTPQPSPDGEQQPTPQPSPDGEQQQTPQPSPDGEQQQTPQPSPDGEQQQTPQPSPDGEQQQTPQPSPDGEQQQTQQPQQTPDGQPQPAPGQRLREMGQRQQAARERRSVAERLRSAADRLRDGEPSPRDEAWRQRWARGNEPGREAGTGGPPPRAVDAEDIPLDIGGPDAGEVKVGEWLDDRPGAVAGESRMTARPGSPTVARRAAERAVNEDAVPSRYHRFIKRYFERLSDPAPPAPAPAPAPAPPPPADAGS